MITLEQKNETIYIPHTENGIDQVCQARDKVLL